MFFAQKISYFLLLLLLSSVVSAADVNYSIGLSISKYDNINLVQDPVRGETSESITGTFVIVEDSANLNATLNASLESVHYRNNQADDENIGNLFANALYVISPGRYEWFISDRFTQTLTDTFGANTPENRRNTNAFSTGPNFIWRINSRNNLNLDARAETTSFETSQSVIGADADNERLEIATRWNYQLQSASSISLNYITEVVDFDNDVLNSNFDKNDLFLNFRHEKGRNTYEADTGITHIDYRDREDVHESRFSLSVLNSRTRNSSIRLRAIRNLTDTSTELLNQDIEDIDNVDTEVNAADVFLEKRISIIYNKTLSSGNLRIDLNRTINEYQQQTLLDRKEKSVFVTGEWNIRRASTLSLVAEYTNAFFVNTLVENDDSIYTLLYRYNARRNIEISLRATAEERKSSDLTEEFEDTRFTLSLTYRT